MDIYKFQSKSYFIHIKNALQSKICVHIKTGIHIKTVTIKTVVYTQIKLV